MDFQQLLIRWYQFAVYSAVLRMHGDRQPHPLDGESGLTASCGADNEVWSFGEENYPIFVRYLRLREAMRPYIRGLMRQFHERGTPIMRPLFYHYPEDAEAWNIADGYLFGPDVLVAPILEAGAVRRRVYLPRGSRWLECATGLWHEGGQWVESPAPLDTIPLFRRDGVFVPGLSDER